jgi:hypothetical protein
MVWWKEGCDHTGSLFAASNRASYGFENEDVATPLKSSNGLLARWDGVVAMLITIEVSMLGDRLWLPSLVYCRNETYQS